MQLVLAFSLITSFSGCSESKEEIKTPVANTETTLAIEGMMCEKGCKSTIQSHLREMDGVISADVDYEAKKAVISHDNRVVTSTDMIDMINTLADSIYTAKLVEEKKIEHSAEHIETSKAKDEISVGNSFTLPDFLEIFSEMI